MTSANAMRTTPFDAPADLTVYERPDGGLVIASNHASGDRSAICIPASLRDTVERWISEFNQQRRAAA